MLAEDPQTGLEANVVLLVNGEMSEEFMHPDVDIVKDGVFVRVEAGAVLALQITVVASVPIFYCDVLIDGVSRRFKSCQIEPETNPVRLTTFISSVWCRDENTGMLHWGAMEVGRTVAPPKSATARDSPRPGTIEVQISLPTRGNGMRPRPTPSYTDHMNEIFPVQPTRFVDKFPLTHLISIIPSAVLPSDQQGLKHPSEPDARPGSVPWQSFRFNYRSKDDITDDGGFQEIVPTEAWALERCTSNEAVTAPEMSTTISSVDTPDTDPQQSVPSSIATVPPGRTSIPGSTVTASREQTPSPSSMVTVLPGQTSVPSSMATAPLGQTSTPSSVATVPRGQTSVPHAMVTAPLGRTSVPSSMDTAPRGQISLPNLMVTGPVTQASFLGTSRTAPRTLISSSVWPAHCPGLEPIDASRFYGVPCGPRNGNARRGNTTLLATEAMPRSDILAPRLHSTEAFRSHELPRGPRNGYYNNTALPANEMMPSLGVPAPYTRFQPISTPQAHGILRGPSDGYHDNTALYTNGMMPRSGIPAPYPGFLPIGVSQSYEFPRGPRNGYHNNTAPYTNEMMPLWGVQAPHPGFQLIEATQSCEIPRGPRNGYHDNAAPYTNEMMPRSGVPTPHPGFQPIEAPQSYEIPRGLRNANRGSENRGRGFRNDRRRNTALLANEMMPSSGIVAQRPEIQPVEAVGAHTTPRRFRNDRYRNIPPLAVARGKKGRGRGSKGSGRGNKDCGTGQAGALVSKDEADRKAFQKELDEQKQARIIAERMEKNKAKIDKKRKADATGLGDSRPTEDKQP